MEMTDSFAYTKKVLEGYETKIKEEIRNLGGNEILSAIVERLSQMDK
jgi:hypothetical protein